LQNAIKYGLFNVPNSILYSVAMLYMYEAVPIIRKNMQHYNRNVAELCLARLGDTALQAKILRENVYTPSTVDDESWMNNFIIKSSKLGFLGTQEGIYELRNWLDDTTHQNPAYRYINSDNWAVYDVVEVLKIWIKNPDFWAMTKDQNIDGYCPCSYEYIMRVKQWLIDNKGKYIISKEYCPPCN